MKFVKVDQFGKESLHYELGNEFITVTVKDHCPYKITQFPGADFEGWIVKVKKQTS